MRRVAGAPFGVGELVKYWSGRYKRWIDTSVEKVNLTSDGEVVSYDLVAKRQDNEVKAV